MAQRALDSDGSQSAIVVEEAGHADDRVQLEQCSGRGRVVEINLAGLDLRDQLGGERLRVNLQAKTQGRLRTHPFADAAELLAGKGLMQPQLAAPEVLGAERVEAKCVLTLL